MNLAETIVARLLNEEHFDVHQRTDLYTHTGQTTPDGRKVINVCMNCEAEYGADKQYPPDVSPSHGLCMRHLLARFTGPPFNWSLEMAKTKVAPGPRAVDWAEVLGPSKEPPQAAAPRGSGSVVWNPHKEDATPPKATFWATSGSGGV